MATGRDERDLVQVSDVVEARRFALHAGGDGVVDTGTGRSRIVRDGLAAPARPAGHGGDPVHTGARPGEQRRSAIDWRRSWRLLQWQATLPFELGVAPTVASLRPDARTPAQGCDGPARVSGPTAGQVSGAGWRQ